MIAFTEPLFLSKQQLSKMLLCVRSKACSVGCSLLVEGHYSECSLPVSPLTHGSD